MIAMYLSLLPQGHKYVFYTELFLYVTSSCFSLGGVVLAFSLFFFSLNQILASYMGFALQPPEPFANFAYL